MTLIEKNDGKYESSKDNIAEQVDWIVKQTKRELSLLQAEVQEDNVKKSFFENTENDNVIYNMDLVKQYLQSCLQKDNFQINPVVVTAIQIALEAQGYELGKIDGLLKLNNPSKKSLTEKAIIKFQRKNLLKPDGIPGKKTIGKILEVLGTDEIIAETSTDIPTQISTDIPTQTSTDTPTQTSTDTPTQTSTRGEPKRTQIINRQRSNPNTTNPTTNRRETQTSDKVNFTKAPIRPIFRNGSNFELENRDDFLDCNILQGPKLKASKEDLSQLGGIGSSMMQGFSDYSRKFKNMNGVQGATTRSKDRFWKTGQRGVLDKEKLKRYCNEKGIKSFVLYFGGNEAASSQKSVDNAYQDIKCMGEYLESIGIQPVLCTCIGEKKDEHSIGRNKKNYPLTDGPDGTPGFNSKIRSLGKGNNWPVIDYAKIDIGNVWYDRPGNAHPSTRGYSGMSKKIIENLS